MKKLKILIAIVILIVVASGVYSKFVKKENQNFSLFSVSRGSVVQEVSETGTVKTGEEISLSFKNAGRIEKIYMETGETVKSGDPLAKLETAQPSIQLKEAQANLEVSEAQVRIAQTSVSNYQIFLETAQQDLTDTTADADQDLANAYEDALNTLDDAYLKIYNTLNTVKIIQIAYFQNSDQQGLAVVENKDLIDSNLTKVKTYLDTAKSDSSNENIDTALSETKKSLDKVFSSLTIIRQACEETLYRDTVSQTDKISLDTHRTNINATLTSVVNAQQVISSTKITNDTNINAVKNQILTAEGNLEKAKNDIDLYAAKVKQAESQANLLKNQIYESAIISPSSGQITKINKKAGETVQPAESVFSFLSSGPLQVEVDIYEEDIVKVKVGDPVDIKLTAFPGEVFQGKVISIDPAEKLIDGVVYYEVNIDFSNAPQGIRPGMTADISIKIAQKDNILVIPGAAIENKDGKNFVQVVKDEKTEEREVETGLEGSDNTVEIISGLQEVEQVAIPK